MNTFLTEARKKKKLCRRELAKLLGISESMVLKVETGTRRASPDLAGKWAKVLNIAESKIYQYFLKNKPDIL